MREIAVSGYFTAIHKGHIKLFEAAAELGDHLTVIVNNNKQQIRKKGRLVQDCNDIKYILQRLEMVDEVVISYDKDETVCKTLEKLDPHIFANGGDRKKGNIPEYKTCKELDIEMVFGVGGEKINSSSNILKKTSMGEIQGQMRKSVNKKMDLVWKAASKEVKQSIDREEKQSCQIPKEY